MNSNGAVYVGISNSFYAVSDPEVFRSIFFPSRVSTDRVRQLEYMYATTPCIPKKDLTFRKL